MEVYNVVVGFFKNGGVFMIPIVVILALGALLTVYSLVRSLFIKVESEDPGRPLSQTEAPGLYALTREVAQAVGGNRGIGHRFVFLFSFRERSVFTGA